ncbi:hypothetical protein ABID59_000026 [Bradyrhizobium sp. S3.3.6]
MPLRSIGYWKGRFVEKTEFPTNWKTASVGPCCLSRIKMGWRSHSGIADAENESGWSNEDIPSKHAIRGLQGATLRQRSENGSDPDRCVWIPRGRP